MPNFLEDPSVLTKDKLKSELLANSVALPPGEHRKDVYVQLYKRHLSARNSKASSGASRDFSSDEEREATPRRLGRPKKATKKTDKPRPEDADDFDVTELSNEDLKEELLKYGFNPGPIIGSTRWVYEKRLLKLKDKGAEVPPPAAASSTAEESKQNGNDSDQYSDDDDPEIILKLEKREPLKKTQVNLRQTLVEHNQTFSNDTETSWTSGSTRTESRQTSARETAPVWRGTSRKRVGAAEPFDEAVISGNLPVTEPLASSNKTFTAEDTTEVPEIPEQILEWLNRPPIKVFPHEVDLERNNTTFSNDIETSWTSGSTRTESRQPSARETPVWRRTSRKRVGAAEPFDEAVISGNLPLTEPLTSSNKTFTHSEYEKYETQQVGNKVTGNFKHSAPLLSSGDFSGLPRRTPKKTLIHDEEVLEKISTEERKFEKDLLKEMFPYEASTPTGISVSCRRPIKGAAGRPVPLSEYKMEESYSAKYVPNYTSLADVKSQPAKKGRSLPVWIKILLFVLVAVFLFLVYQAMETNEVNPFPNHRK